MSTINANLDAALALAGAGISVFPVKLIKKSDANWDKLPLIKDWPNNASSDCGMRLIVGLLGLYLDRPQNRLQIGWLFASGKIFRLGRPDGNIQAIWGI